MTGLAIADTHGLHQQLILPQADLIIHAGDVSRRGEAHEIKDLLNWFRGLSFPCKEIVF